MNASLDRILDKIVADPDREREFLDLLSQLEYVGCRKIMKALSYEDISLEVLQHIADEAQHAFQLKNIVNHGEPKKTSWGTNPLSEAGWTYFQTLDQEISKLPQVSDLSYPAVSAAVEQRVLRVYPLYYEKTKNPDVKRVLGGIIAQERRHGSHFDTANYPEELRSRMLTIEDGLWNRFLGALEHHLDADKDGFAPGRGYRSDVDVSATD